MKKKKGQIMTKKFTWELRYSDVRMPVKVKARPTINIEETEINYCGNKSTIPGKSYWELMTLTMFEVKDALKLIEDSPKTLSLVLLDINEIEQWVINEVTLEFKPNTICHHCGQVLPDKELFVEMKYSGVKYYPYISRFTTPEVN